MATNIKKLSVNYKHILWRIYELCTVKQWSFSVWGPARLLCMNVY